MDDVCSASHAHRQNSQCHPVKDTSGYNDQVPFAVLASGTFLRFLAISSVFVLPPFDVEDCKETERRRLNRGFAVAVVSV